MMRAALLAALLLAGCASSPIHVGVMGTLGSGMGDGATAGAWASLERATPRTYTEAVASAIEADHGAVGGWQWGVSGRALYRVAGALWLGGGYGGSEVVTSDWRYTATAPQVVMRYGPAWVIYAAPDSSHHQTESIVLSWRHEVRRWRVVPRIGWVRFDGHEPAAILGLLVGWRVSP